MYNQLKSSIPVAAHKRIEELLSGKRFEIKIKNPRKTRHGDYRKLREGGHVITINNNLNKYRFLITLVHEIAHYETYLEFGSRIKPHGLEWKQTYQHLMLPFLRPEIFPGKLLGLLAQHFKNPKASTDSDQVLSMALRDYDRPNGKITIFEIAEGSKFKASNGKFFRKGPKRRTRYKCIELESGRVYLFAAFAEIEPI